ncbi:MAG: HAMP domain-containing histidine kinase [Deltaproteobacteria bacterium]|nr:HAMP domain-containing histidine kinase [Deltaproteobacteria bacterium]
MHAGHGRKGAIFTKPVEGPLLASLVLAAVVGALRFFVPADIAISILYAVPLAVAAWSRSPLYVWLLGGGLTMVNFASYRFGRGPLASSVEVTLVNRVGTGAIILVLTFMASSLCTYAARNEALRRLAEEKEREATRANQLKDEILTRVSHDLRTPLTALLAWVHVMRRKAHADVALSRGFEVIERSARAEANLVDDLVDVARIARGRLHVKSEPLDLSGLVADVVEALGPAASKRGITLSSRAESVEVPILGDHDRLEQVLWNLLMNAFRHTEEGGRVDVVSRHIGESAELEVCDTGEGIEPELLPHILDPFQRDARMGAVDHGGLGLGLTIAREIVQLHNGRILVSSAGKGMGSQFKVILPALAA